MADIPQVAGVPALLTGFASAAASGNIGLMVADLVSSFFGGSSQWGIFLNGSPVVVADNVVTFEFKRDWATADYPLEQGAFETYAKVQIPFLPRIRFSAGGSASARQALLASIAAIAGDYNKYDVVTPEATYIGANIDHYDYHRAAASGAGLIVVDVWLREIRVAVSEVSGGSKAASGSGSGSGSGSPSSPSGSNVQSPSASPQTNSGTVQAKTPEAVAVTQGSNVG